ncbi:hypothetical protein M153_2890006287 [Pseudoloma neurophilia]|uniref:Uncharacterized protein n=1 Tax=Pseudoloma neurophilia TaxID=146866 RepID=A0A0R0LYK1_9MICR|nr:hypothetical protein M153_2890006287 [Pseudoloma neurophilia]
MLSFIGYLKVITTACYHGDQKEYNPAQQEVPLRDHFDSLVQHTQADHSNQLSQELGPSTHSDQFYNPEDPGTSSTHSDLYTPQELGPSTHSNQIVVQKKHKKSKPATPLHQIDNPQSTSLDSTLNDQKKNILKNISDRLLVNDKLLDDFLLNIVFPRTLALNFRTKNGIKTIEQWMVNVNHPQTHYLKELSDQIFNYLNMLTNLFHKILKNNSELDKFDVQFMKEATGVLKNYASKLTYLSDRFIKYLSYFFEKIDDFRQYKARIIILSSIEEARSKNNIVPDTDSKCSFEMSSGSKFDCTQKSDAFSPEKYGACSKSTYDQNLPPSTFLIPSIPQFLEMPHLYSDDPQNPFGTSRIINPLGRHFNIATLKKSFDTFFSTTNFLHKTLKAGHRTLLVCEKVYHFNLKEPIPLITDFGYELFELKEKLNRLNKLFVKNRVLARKAFNQLFDEIYGSQKKSNITM